MSGEARRWLQYAWENRQIAQISLERGFFNPCLQNAQQAVEKALKALWIAEGLPLKKTHSIQELTGDLRHRGIDVELEDDDCELLDSVYLPSKYPLGSALPDFEPDEAIARLCLAIADRVLAKVERMGPWE